MRVRPLKYLVQLVLLEEDEQGDVIGERVAEPVALYSAGAVAQWLTQIDEQVAALNAEAVTTGGPDAD